MGHREAVTVFSNRLEVLYDHLKVDLFSKIEEQDRAPYLEKLIVVKTKAAKSYLQRKLACEL